MGFVVFGAGKRGKWFYNTFKEEYNITCFCDNDRAKQGEEHCGLPIIAPEEIPSSKLAVIIPVNWHVEAVRQLFDLGIKEFYILNMYDKSKVCYIDLSQYDDLSENPRRICLIERWGVGGSARAMMKYNPYDDIELYMVDDGYGNFFKNGKNYYAFITSALFVTQNMENVNGKKCIELWHGFPIKGMHYASHDLKSQDYGNYANFVLNGKRDMICSYSRLYNMFFGYCNRLGQEKFCITGMPRNDLLLRENSLANLKKLIGGIKHKKAVIYTPTFRESASYGIRDMKEGNIFSWPDFDPGDFDAFLKERDIILLVKIHLIELAEIKVPETENIVLLTNDMFIDNDVHLYEILGAADMLISDYSSITIDYLLLDKPIVFAIRDVEDYTNKHGLMMEPLDAWAPGECVMDYPALKSAIDTALFGEDMYKRDREKLRRMTHKFEDADSTRRVLDLAKRILEEG